MKTHNNAIGLVNSYLTIFSGAVKSWVKEQRDKHGNDNLLDNLECMANTLQEIAKKNDTIILVFHDNEND